MDPVAVAKKLKKIGKVEMLAVGPAKEEQKEEKIEEKKGQKQIKQFHDAIAYSEMRMDGLEQKFFNKNLKTSQLYKSQLQFIDYGMKFCISLKI